MMYVVKPIQTKEDQKILCERCGVEFDADCLAYFASTEQGELIGVCQFIMIDDSGYIRDIKNAPEVEDFEAMYIMGRATLNFIDLCGIKKAYYEKESNNLIDALGFKPNGQGKLFIDLKGFFEHHCKDSQK